MVGTVRVRINAERGKIDLEASAEDFDTVLARVEAFLSTFKADVLAAHTSATEDAHRPTEDTPLGDAVKPKRRPQAQPSIRREGGNSGAVTKLGTPFYADFVSFDLGIGDEREIELAAFFEEKKPTNGNENVLVVIYKLSNILDRNVTYDEIFQALRICRVSEPPKNLSAAVGKLVDRNFVTKEASGLRIKIQGSDFVENELPKKSVE